MPPRRRPRSIRWVAVGVALLVVLPLLGVLAARVARGPTLVRSPLLGKPAPDFSLPRFDRPGAVSSAELTGRPYVVNFWASWCVPCREETVVLETFYRRWQPRGVELIGILYADEQDSALEFRRQYGGSWPLVDDNGATALEFGVRGVPETFVVDESGIIMAKLVGAVSAGTLDEVMAQVAAGSAPVYSKNDRYRKGP
ncbi:MAG TPA: redoxin domain-containing protein [Acidimicrobiales bacterium]|nr:redoxin domain-containing protein [Acidimicrobiales bacterium]